VGRAAEEQNRRLLRARDAMDRTYAGPLDVRRSPADPDPAAEDLAGLGLSATDNVFGYGKE
jgi:hypothetical protein